MIAHLRATLALAGAQAAEMPRVGVSQVRADVIALNP